MLTDQTRISITKSETPQTPSYQASYIGPDDRLHKAPETFAAKIDAEAGDFIGKNVRRIDTPSKVSSAFTCTLL